MGREQANCVPEGVRILATKSGDAKKSSFDGHEVLSMLSARYGASVRGGELRIPCPAHGGTDRTSLALSMGPSGKVLVICHSGGCPFQEIAAALECECSARVSAPARHSVPDSRSGGTRGESDIEHRLATPTERRGRR